MKRRILLLLLITIALSIVLVPTEAEASDVIKDTGYSSETGLFWYLYADDYSSRSGYTLRVSKWYAFGEIPDNLKYQSWDKYNSGIEAVRIGSDLTQINTMDFANMPKLSSVSIPSSILYIESSAFANCPNLRSITLPHGLRGLGTHAFANTGITSVNIPTSVNEIGLNPFYGCNIRNIYYCGTQAQWNQISFAGDTDWADGVLSYHRWQDATCTTPKTCRYCNKTEGSPAEHTWKDATCTQPKQCACGATEGEPLGHAYQGEVYIAATCSVTGQMKYKCTRCSSGTYFETIEKIPHTYGEWKPQPSLSTGHLHQCTVCGQGESGKCTYDEGVVTREPTCGEWGESIHTCTLCGRTQTRPIDRLPHGESKWVYNSLGNHRAVCTVCNQNTGETENHTWDAGMVTKEPTCISYGERTYTCTVCKGTKTEKINTLASHQFASWTSQDGWTHYHKCTVCEYIEVYDHTWNSGAITKWPTCAEEGIRLHTCTVCNGTREFYIDRLTEHAYDHPCDTDCNVCGEVRTVPHSFSDTWIKTTDRHYRECSICGAQQGSSIHTAGPAATETTPQTCTVCGYILSPVLNHTHKYETTWSINRNGHWHACVGCEALQDYSGHKFDNACDTDCNVCGYERFTNHVYGTSYQSNAESHWFVCTVCGDKKDITAHEPGPEATATTAQICTICGYEIAPPVPEASEPPAPSTKPATTPSTTAPKGTEPSGLQPNNTSTPSDSADTVWVIIGVALGLVVCVGSAVIFLIKKKRK